MQASELSDAIRTELVRLGPAEVLHPESLNLGDEFARLSYSLA